jgi:glutathione S-transferase
MAPIVEDGGDVLIESGAILETLLNVKAYMDRLEGPGLPAHARHDSAARLASDLIRGPT